MIALLNVGHFSMIRTLPLAAGYSLALGTKIVFCQYVPSPQNLFGQLGMVKLLASMHVWHLEWPSMDDVTA